MASFCLWGWVGALGFRQGSKEELWVQGLGYSRFWVLAIGYRV